MAIGLSTINCFMSSRSLISFSSTTALAISVRYREQRYDDVLELS